MTNKTLRNIVAGAVTAGAIMYGAYDFSQKDSVTFKNTYQGYTNNSGDGDVTLVFCKYDKDQRDLSDKINRVVSPYAVDYNGNELKIGQDYEVKATGYKGALSKRIMPLLTADEIKPANYTNKLASNIK